jgi:hypothetical protein
MNKVKVSVLIISLIVISYGCIYAYNFYIETPSTQTIFATSLFDFSKKNELVGGSENVFIAKVSHQTGDIIGKSGLPNTQFEVNIIRNIKGKLDGAVTVNQKMGYEVNEFGQRELIKFDNQELLVPGHIYLFATIYYPDMNYHSAVPVYGEVPIDNESIGETVSVYLEAFKNQIIPEAFKNRGDLEVKDGFDEATEK